MAHIKVREDFTPPPGREWESAIYPGNGAYRLTNGIFMVASGVVYQIGMPGWELLISGGKDSGSGAIDVHRLFDQIITIAGKPLP